MKFLIAGLGSIGRRHIRNLWALGERDILLYRTHRSTLPEDEFASLPIETDLRAALAHCPEAVIIANPTALHLDVAIPAARAGCHLFIEKPISHTLAHLDELEAALQHGGGRALVGFQFRFHPGLQRMAGLLREGVIGRVLSARAHWGEYLPGWHPWEDYRQGYSARRDLGGGVILTLCHPLDYLSWLVGEVDSIWAFAGKLSDLELDVEDTAEIGLHFQTGALGSIHLDYIQRPPTHTLEIIGTRGTLRWENSSGMVSLYQPFVDTPLPFSSQKHSTRGSTSPSSLPGTWIDYPAPEGFERNDMFLDEMRHFLKVAHGEAEPVCTLHDGRKTLALALAAQRSAQSGILVTLENCYNSALGRTSL